MSQFLKVAVYWWSLSPLNWTPGTLYKDDIKQLAGLVYLTPSNYYGNFEINIYSGVMF